MLIQALHGIEYIKEAMGRAHAGLKGRHRNSNHFGVE